MNLSIKKFFKKRPEVFFTTSGVKENCFCGAGFEAMSPTFYRDGEVSFAFDISEQIEYWHLNHYHQANPGMSRILDTDTTEAVSDAPTRELGFHVPGH